MAAPPSIGVIGGSGFYSLFTAGEEIKAETPYGPPSDPIVIGEVAGRQVAFLPRHGRDHRFPPHRIPFRANLWALRALGVRQILLPELNRVDSCSTCHLGVEDPSYGGYPQPLAYHPLHEQHPFEKFGCTVCHRGQGRATTSADAHGNVSHWDQPMLPLRFIQASCGQCHEAADNPAAPQLARGQQVFESSGCRGGRSNN